MLKFIGSVFATVLLLAATAAHANDWPTQPVRLILPYPPGGASDVTARLLADQLGARWRVPVIVENRPGANGIIANELVARATPDGYAVLMANLGPNAINHAVYAALPYDSLRDFAPVILTTKVPLVVTVNADTAFQDMPSMIAHARQSQLAFGSAGTGAGSHLAGELLASMTGANLLHVPYKGDAAALTDLMGGQIAFALPTAIAVMPHLRGGRVKALAVASETRLPSLPQVPTVAEVLHLPAYAATSWGGFMVPAGTPPAIIQKLNTDIDHVLHSDAVKTRLEDQGAMVVGGTPEAFDLFLRDELRKWKQVAAQAHIQLN